MMDSLREGPRPKRPYYEARAGQKLGEIVKTEPVEVVDAQFEEDKEAQVPMRRVSPMEKAAYRAQRELQRAMVRGVVDLIDEVFQ